MRVFALLAAIVALAVQVAAEGPKPNRPRCAITTPSPERIEMDCPLSDHVRFIGLGDWGETFEAPYVLAVRDGVLKEVAKGKYDFLFSVGDNFYVDGVNSTIDTLWESVWRQRWQIGTNMTLPWMAILGNHDHHLSYQAQIDFHDSNQTDSQYWYMPSTRFSINVAAKHKSFKITTVDTVILNTTDLAWFASELADSTPEFILASGHYQMYSLNERGDTKDPMMLAMNQILQSSPKAKAYLCGHEHDMQYFTSGSRDYFMFGGGGRTINPQVKFPNSTAHNVYFSRNYGFAMFDVDVPKHTMEVTYVVYDPTGKEIARPKFQRQY